MIGTYLISETPHLYVVNGSMPYTSTSINCSTNTPNSAMTGVLRLNQGKIEVFDGYSWSALYMGTTTVGISSSLNNVINWATEKMKQEEEYSRLAKEYPSIQTLLENFDKAKQMLDTAVALVKDCND